MTALHFRAATVADLEILLEMMRTLYAFERLEFDEAAACAALKQLVENSGFGQVWLVQARGAIAGYVVLGLGFSLEYHGRDAFVDEIYIREEFRGQGLGRRALQFIENVCCELGVRALRLEVQRENTSAQRVYLQRGFVDHDRYLLTKRL